MNTAGVKITDNICLIMDELDGMSAGGQRWCWRFQRLDKENEGVPSFIYSALGMLILPLVFQIPIICTANDRGARKLKPLLANTFNMSFRRYASNSASGGFQDLTATEA